MSNIHVYRVFATKLLLVKLMLLNDFFLVLFVMTSGNEKSFSFVHLRPL